MPSGNGHRRPDIVERRRKPREIAEHRSRPACRQQMRLMITPIDAERMRSSRPRHLHVEGRIADQHCFGRIGARLAHGAAQHLGMRLRWRVIRRLQRHEIVAKAMGLERMAESALRLARGDAEQHILLVRQQIERLAHAGKERFRQFLPRAQLEEGALVAFGQLAAQR